MTGVFALLYLLVATTTVSKASVPVNLPMSVCVMSAGRRWIALWTAAATITAHVNMASVSVTSVFIGRLV